LVLAYLFLRPLHYPYEIRLRTGDILSLADSGDLIVFWLIFVRKHYPVSSSDLAILDIGANVGFFTLYAAREAPSARIIAVEPFPDTFERLRQLVTTNAIESRVTTVNCAITASSGAQLMESSSAVPSQYRAVLSPLTNRLNAPHKRIAKPSEDGVRVQSQTPLHLLESQSIDRIDLVKMNIHGNEYKVLLLTPPSVLRRFGRVAVQYHEVPLEFNLGKEQLIEHMRRAGFDLVLDRDTLRGAGLAVFAAAC
jgi:FkbM family methyltransferase